MSEESISEVIRHAVGFNDAVRAAVRSLEEAQTQLNRASTHHNRLDGTMAVVANSWADIEVIIDKLERKLK